MSRDNELGIERQRQDCHAEAARRGWTVVAEYTDDGVSATKRSPRPAYDRLLSAVRSGRVSNVLVWDSDRLTRKPREAEDWIDLADERGVRLVTASGSEPLLDPFAFGVRGQVSRHEVVQLKKRLRRSLVQRAEAGKPHGRQAYGWTAALAGDGKRRVRTGRDELDPVAAEVIRDAATALLAGRSMRSIVAELNAAGAVTASGGPWSTTQLKMILLRPRNAGIRVHQGQELCDGDGEPIYGDWPPIYEKDGKKVHDRVVAALTDPLRRTRGTGGQPAKHLLSGLAVCGNCGARMVTNPGRRPASDGSPRPVYWCRSCFLTRDEKQVDRFVTDVMVERLSDPDVLAELAADSQDPDRMAAARAELAALTAKLDRATDSFVADKITDSQLERITAAVRPKIEKARTLIASLLPGPDLSHMAGPDAPQKWEAADLDTRRAVIAQMVTITLLRNPAGAKVFDPDSVDIAKQRRP